MNNEFEAFVNKLQSQIFDEAQDALGELGFQRWRNPLYSGRMENPDAHACVTGQCGDTMEIFLKFENDRVENASFMTTGCASSIVCGSIAAEIAIGKDPDTLSDVTGEAILERLGRFPKEDKHCAFLAAATVKEALDQYMRQCVEKSK